MTPEEAAAEMHRQRQLLAQAPRTLAPASPPGKKPTNVAPVATAAASAAQPSAALSPRRVAFSERAVGTVPPQPAAQPLRVAGNGQRHWRAASV
jgi:hypothetical protein